MNTKMKMRMLSLLLCCVMLLSLLPTTALAADTDEDTVITFAHATVDVPVAEAKPDFDLEVPEQSHYTAEVAAWKCDDDGSTLTRDDVFEKGKSYTVYIDFSAEEGWKISSGGNCKINGDYAPGYDDSNEFKRRLSFDVINELIPSVNVTGIKTPVAGELPDVSGIVTDTKGITFDTINWLGHNSGGPISGDGKFKAGDTYDLKIKFTTDKYYALADGATVTTDFACENKVLGIEEKVIVLTYTIPDPDKLYTLGIVQGSSTKFSYKAGEEVTIVAFTPSESEKFDHWAGGGNLDYTEGSVNTPTATFIMPARNVFLDAEYVDAATTYDITVTGGTASANKAVAGTVITLTVDESAIPAGKVFDKWEVVSGGVTITDGKFTMPESAVEIKATYKDAPVSHTCDIKPVAKDEPSCTEGGKEAYYKCEGCGKFYEDALGAKEITDIDAWGNLEKLGHTESDWKFDKDNHWKECTVTACGVIIEDSKAAHKDDNKDGKCDVCEYNVGLPTTPDDDKPNDNPQTGDNSNMFLWIALLFISGAGVVATVYGKKRFSAK